MDDVKLEDALAGFGPFAQASVHRFHPGEPWLAIGTLMSEPDLCQARIKQVRLALRPSFPNAALPEWRVAASTTHLGLVARLVCIEMAVRCMNLQVSWSTVVFRNVLGGPLPISIEPPTPAVSPIELPPIVVGLTNLCEPWIGGHVAWGNVASTINSAAAQIRLHRRDQTSAVTKLAARLLTDPRVAPHFTGSPDGTFRRRSCCLIYRLSEDNTAVCGDCVLAGRRPTRH